MFLMQLQWLKTTLVGLESCVYPKLHQYDVRRLQRGPLGHKLLITHLMVHLLHSSDVTTRLVLIADSSKPHR